MITGEVYTKECDESFGRRGTITATCNWDKEVYIEGRCESKYISLISVFFFVNPCYCHLMNLYHRQVFEIGV